MTSAATRVLFAIAGGCAAASAITTLGLAALNLGTSSASSSDTALAYLAWLALSFVVTMLLSGTLGLAWHTFCQAKRWTSVHWYWTAGALVGAALGGVWFLPAGSLMIAAILTPYGATLGGLVGLFAWLIRRPDRAAARTSGAG